MSEMPPMKTVDMKDLVEAQVIEVDFGLPADKRCIRCNAQAFVEIEMFVRATTEGEQDRLSVFEMCAHHYGEHEPKLKASANRIVDHRPALLATK